MTTKPNREYGDKVFTGKAELAFPYVASPDIDQAGKAKYRVTLLFDPKDPDVLEKLKLMKQECQKIAAKAFGNPIPADIKMPFKDGNPKADKYPNFKDKIVVSAATTRKPGVVDKSGKRMEDLDIQSEIYGGCYVRCSLVPATYSGMGRGVSFYLQNLQKMDDGVRYGGQSADPEDEFGAVNGDSGVEYNDQDTLGF